MRNNEAQETQTDQRNTRPSQTTNDGNARQNAASTGAFTAGETDRPGDTVVISPEARNVAEAEANAAPEPGAVQAEANAAPAFGAAASGPAAEAPRGTASTRDSVVRTPETDQRGPAQTAPATAQPAATAVDRAEATETAAADDTNQRVRNENSNAEVNGSRAGQSEQTRTIGQVVDVFA